MSGIPNSLQMEPEARSAALHACYQQVRQWGIALPFSEPLVMDFGLGDFEHYGLIEFWIANEVQAGYCGKYMFVFDGQMCPRHYHRFKHETFFAVRGTLAVTLDSNRMILNEGMALSVAPGHTHSFQGVGPALMLELSMPTNPQDNYFEMPQIMSWLRTNVGAPVAEGQPTAW